MANKALFVEASALFVERIAFSMSRNVVPLVGKTISLLGCRVFMAANAHDGSKTVVLLSENDRLAPSQRVSVYLTRIDVGKLQSPIPTFVVTR